MRIGIEATAALVHQKTGIERYAAELLAALSKEVATNSNLELYLYFHKGNRFVNERSLEQHLSYCSERVRCRSYGLHRGYGLTLPLMAVMDRLELLHLLDLRAPRFKPCAMLLTVHDIGWACLPDEGVRVEAATLRPLAERIIGMADGFIAVSHCTAKDLRETYPVSTDRAWVVQHGVDHSLSTGLSTADPVAPTYGLQQYILYVGALQYRKNLVRLLQAYSVLKSRYHIPHSLALAGRDGPGSEQVYSAAEQLGLQQDVRFLGYVPDKDLWGLYSEASLVVYPSIYEGFGIPILEALSCGAVTAASNAASIPEVGEDAVIYFDPYSIEDMAATVYEGLTNQPLRDDLRDRGRRRASQFTWQRAAQKTIAVYRQLAEKA